MIELFMAFAVPFAVVAGVLFGMFIPTLFLLWAMDKLMGRS